MKKSLLFLLLAIAAASILFAGSPPAPGRGALTICATRADEVDQLVISKFLSAYPDQEIEWIGVDVSTGAPITISALLAAGTPPDIYVDFMARAGAYLDPGYAVEITDYAAYDPGLMGQLSRGGKIYGLPQTTRLLSMFVNNDLMEKINYTIPHNWTTDDFMEMCEKAVSMGVTPYTVFAANQSSCEWLLGWFPAFGVEFFQGGDYSKTVVKSTGGEKVFQFILDLYKAGYIPEESPVLSDDDAQAMILQGQVATSGTYINNWDAGIQSAVDQGALDAPFGYTFVSYPRAPGVNTVPLPSVFPLVIGHKSGDPDRDKMIAFLVECFSNADYQSYMANTSAQYTSRVDAVPVVDDKQWLTGYSLANENGTYNFGGTLSCYGEIRASLYPRLQALLTGKETPAEAIGKYEVAINEALNQ